MAYTKTNWENDVTELSAENFNHIEDGIYNSTNLELYGVYNEISEVPINTPNGKLFYLSSTNKIYEVTSTGAYHEFADEQSRITMIFSSLEDTMLSLIIHIDLNSKKLIRVRSTTDMNYFINKFNEFGINMDVLQQMHTLPMLVKRKFELSDKLTSELLLRMSGDLKSFHKMMSK